MKSLYRRKRMMVLAALSLGTAFQFASTTNGCGEYVALFGLSSFDFCSVFNCTGGGFFNFCDPNVLFVDCPNFEVQ